jgi:hypothetical protein
VKNVLRTVLGVRRRRREHDDGSRGDWDIGVNL